MLDVSYSKQALTFLKHADKVLQERLIKKIVNGQKLVRNLRGFIAKNFGKPCPDYSPFCANCIMWGAFETIKEGAER